MANKKLCRFCSEGFVPQRTEGICPKCSMEVSRAVSLPPGEPIFVDPKNIETLKKTAGVITKIIIDEAKLVPEKSPDIPEETKEILKEEVKEPETIVKETVPTIPIPDEIMPEPEPDVPKSPEEDRIQKDVVNPTED